MREAIATLLEEIIAEGKKQGLDQREIAARAGISPETLSRAKKGTDIQFSTLSRLAGAVGLRLSLMPGRPVLEKILSGDLFGGD